MFTGFDLLNNLGWLKPRERRLMGCSVILVPRKRTAAARKLHAILRRMLRREGAEIREEDTTTVAMIYDVGSTYVPWDEYDEDSGCDVTRHRERISVSVEAISESGNSLQVCFERIDFENRSVYDQLAGDIVKFIVTLLAPPQVSSQLLESIRIEDVEAWRTTRNTLNGGAGL